MDVSNKKWQPFCISHAVKLKAKGVDGFFVDNCDVYYQYPNDAVICGRTLGSGNSRGGNKSDCDSLLYSEKQKDL